MELCIARGISNLPVLKLKLTPLQSPLHRTIQLPLLRKQTRFSSRLRYNGNSSLRSAKSDEISTETTQYYEIESGLDGGVIVEDTRPVEKGNEYDNQLSGVQQEDSLADSLQLSKFLEDLDIKFDFTETSSILVFGGGAAVALWLAAAVVGAVDSIPVLPNVLELVGLGYTIWFSSRYLIFKQNRDELVGRIEQLKQQVLGSKGD